MVYDTGVWFNANYPARRDPDALEVNAEINDIGLLFDSVSFFIPSEFATVLKYHMYMGTFGNDVERKSPASLNIIIDHVTFDAQQKAMITLGEAERACGVRVGPTSPIATQWGGGKVPNG